MRLQTKCIEEGFPTSDDNKGLPLYLRYQVTHERAFHKCLNDLLKLRAEKRKAEIGFESQKHKQADQRRRESSENRKKELHRWNVLLAEAKFDHQELQNSSLRYSAAPVSNSDNRTLTEKQAA
jgi:hypothetical protein